MLLYYYVDLKDRGAKPLQQNNNDPHKISRLRARLRLYKKHNFDKRSSIITSVVYHLLTTIVIAMLVVQAISGNYENCFTCALTLILFLIPNFVETRLKITLPQTLEIIIILFIFAAQMLGEISAFYLKFSWWDDMLHTLNGFLMAAVGFSSVDILNKSERFKFRLSPLVIAIVSFCFSMTIGVLWEFCEFSCDWLLHTDMQKDTILQTISSVNLTPNNQNVASCLQGIENVIAEGSHLTLNGQPVAGGTYLLNGGGYIDIGIFDTMSDLFVNFIGAVVFSILGYFYVKNRGKGNFIERFIPRKQNENENQNEIS